MKDHLENAIEKALIEAKIKYKTKQRLDFYLPQHDVYIEVKQYHSDRSNDQLKSQENVIFIQGKKAVELFCKMINPNKVEPTFRNKHNNFQPLTIAE